MNLSVAIVFTGVDLRSAAFESPCLLGGTLLRRSLLCASVARIARAGGGIRSTLPYPFINPVHRLTVVIAQIINADRVNRQYISPIRRATRVLDAPSLCSIHGRPVMAKIASFRMLLLLLLAIQTVCPLSARAGTVVQCAGTVDVSFSPPLTNTVQSTIITVSEVHSPCLHLPLLELPFLLPATSGAQITRDISCTTLLSGGPGVSQVQWANGDSSTFNWNATANYVNGSIVVLRNGMVTAGRYAGETTAETLIESPVLGGGLDFLTACSAGGVPGLQGIYTSDIIP